jgi:outer membrane protein assembly factor BamB
MIPSAYRLGAMTLVLAALLCRSLGARGEENWSRFRGPNGAGQSETSLPASWTEEDYRWRISLPGHGFSSPIQWDDRIFVTSASADGGHRQLFCIDFKNGKTLWQRDTPGNAYKIHKQNSYAASTPCADADRVYVTWVTPEAFWVLAYRHDGELAWKRDLGSFASQHGYAGSPMIWQNELIVNNDQEETDGTLTALNLANGDVVWQTPRRGTQEAYSTPCIWKADDGSEQLIFNCQSHGICGIEPKSGKVLWETPLFDKRSVSSPYMVGKLVIGTCGSGGGGNYLVALRPGTTEPAFKIKAAAPYVPTTVARGDLLFLVSDNGVASCIACPSGEVRWTKRIGGNYSSSLVRAADKVYATASDGEIVVFAAGKEFKELGRMKLGETCRSTPAIAKQSLLIRTESHLMCLSEPASDAEH